MNYNVFMGVLRAMVPGVVGYLAGKWYIAQDQVATLGAAVITLAAAGWSIVTNYQGKGKDT